MQVSIAQSLFISDDGFIQAIEQAIAEQVRPVYKPTIQEHLD
jgi:hypothetical protein